MTSEKQFADLAHDVNGVWQIIGFDVEEAVQHGDYAVLDNETAIECCIDADRLVTFGFPESQKVLHELIKEIGYASIIRLLDERIKLV